MLDQEITFYWNAVLSLLTHDSVILSPIVTTRVKLVFRIPPAPSSGPVNIDFRTTTAVTHDVWALSGDGHHELSTFTPSAAESREYEQAVFGRGFDNGLVTIVRRLMATELLAVNDPGA